MLAVKVEQFEGPLDVLLELIEAEKLDITALSLASVTDQYLERIAQLADHIRASELADFLVIAAKLIYIKSKFLLPYLTKEDEAEIEDLKNQLKIYQEYHRAAKQLEEILGQNRVAYFRPFSLERDKQMFLPPKKVKPETLHQAFTSLLRHTDTEKPPVRIHFDPGITIQEKMALLKDMAQHGSSLSFLHTLSNARSRTEIIVSFLAVLELVKQRWIEVAQPELFGDILIKRKSAVAPGQTLIELIAATFILAVGLVGVLGLTTANVRNQTIGSIRLVASNLAREGIEIARNVRDTNWIKIEQWDTGLVGDQDRCAVLNDTMDGFRFVTSCGDDNAIFTDIFRIYQKNDGRFIQLENPGSDVSRTPYFRRIRFDVICQDAGGAEQIRQAIDCTGAGEKIGIHIISETGWQGAGGTQSTTVVEQLYNWR